jgi:hypothetical protein
LALGLPSALNGVSTGDKTAEKLEGCTDITISNYMAIGVGRGR